MPPKLKRLAARLFEDEAEQEAFANEVFKMQPYRPGLIWMKNRPTDSGFKSEDRPEWLPEFADRLRRDQRPGQDERHDAGDYYCLAFSSIFEASVCFEVPHEPELVIDVCAAPGGKSVFAWRQLNPRRLIANEIIGKRLGPLIGNFKRCGIRPATVTSLDPAQLAEQCPAAADLVIVDAPCSGQSLLSKGKPVTACFHTHVINHNRNRQRRILLNSVKMVKPGGYLAYMTCTYSDRENEGNVKWLLKNMPEFEPVEVGHLKEFRSHLSEVPTYRLWPQQKMGAGGFTALLRRREDTEEESESFAAAIVTAVWKSVED